MRRNRFAVHVSRQRREEAAKANQAREIACGVGVKTAQKTIEGIWERCHFRGRGLAKVEQALFHGKVLEKILSQLGAAKCRNQLPVVSG